MTGKGIGSNNSKYFGSIGVPFKGKRNSTTRLTIAGCENGIMSFYGKETCVRQILTGVAFHVHEPDLEGNSMYFPLAP